MHHTEQATKGQAMIVDTVTVSRPSSDPRPLTPFDVKHGGRPVADEYSRHHDGIITSTAIYPDGHRLEKGEVSGPACWR